MLDSKRYCFQRNGKNAAGTADVTVSVFITSTGAISGYTTLPADHKFSVFTIFRGEKNYTVSPRSRPFGSSSADRNEPTAYRGGRLLKMK